MNLSVDCWCLILRKLREPSKISFFLSCKAFYTLMPEYVRKAPKDARQLYKSGEYVVIQQRKLLIDSQYLFEMACASKEDFLIEKLMRKFNNSCYPYVINPIIKHRVIRSFITKALNSKKLKLDVLARAAVCYNDKAVLNMLEKVAKKGKVYDYFSESYKGMTLDKVLDEVHGDELSKKDGYSRAFEYEWMKNICMRGDIKEMKEVYEMGFPLHDIYVYYSGKKEAIDFLLSVSDDRDINSIVVLYLLYGLDMIQHYIKEFDITVLVYYALNLQEKTEFLELVKKLGPKKYNKIIQLFSFYESRKQL